MYLTHISLDNIRGFKELEIDLCNSDGTFRNRTLFLGKNGTCKTTLLRCLAIGLSNGADASGLLSEPTGTLARNDEKKGLIEITLSPRRDGKQESKSYLTKIQSQKGIDTLVDKQEIPSPHGTLVCGYGIGRGSHGTDDSFRDYRILDSAYSLFVYEAQLIGIEITLRRLRDYLGTQRYNNTLAKIKEAIGLSSKDRIFLPKGGGVKVSGPTVGKTIPLEGWADGYRITCNWILDFYAWAMRADRITPKGEIEGIILIDELEQHIHPSLQTRMLNEISNLFPNVQILATTHSPLIALGAQPEELVVLKRDGKLVHRETPPDFRGYSAEDMLVDDRLFDTNVYSPEMNEKLERYRELGKIAKSKRSKKQRQELRELAGELREQQLPEQMESDLARELKRFREKYDL